MKKSTTATMAFQFAYWIIILLNAGVLDARTTGNLRELAGAPNGLIPQTGFKCKGKLPGYYADTKTDCQVYHLCDEQGRQYSYTCPNATLFQQRMLICDHWYMVNCSASEANYGFNSLIGQRNQPFVSQSDAEKRTPRPDYLDQPYAPSYKGESYKKQIDKSNFPSLQNSLTGIDFSKNINKKHEILETEASSNILPPQIDSNSLDPTLLPASEEFPQFDKTNERRNAFSAESEESGRGFLPPPTGFEPPRVLPSYNDQFRSNEERRLRDLGLPLTTPTRPTRTKASFPSAQNVAQGTKKPGRTFDPDKNFAAFDHFFPSGKATHADYDFSKYFAKKDGVATTRKTTTRQPAFNNQFNNNNRQQFPVGPSAAQRPGQFQSSFNKNIQKPVAAASTARPIVRQQQFAATTKAPATFKPTTPATVRPFVQQTTKATVRAPVTQFVNRQPVKQATRAPVAINKQVTQPASRFQQKQVTSPAKDLLPPLEVVKVYDDATTRGPPVYYDLKEKITEWKVPDNGLLPPRLDNDTDTNALKRSLLEEGNHGDNSDIQSSETRRLPNGNSVKIQYKDLQRYFAIPQIELPLESTGRDGYDKDDAVNSFQVKIPYRQGAAKSPVAERYYYLEHGHCNPECHPYFFKPGRCEPCIKL